MQFGLETSFFFLATSIFISGITNGISSRRRKAEELSITRVPELAIFSIYTLFRFNY